MKRLLSQRILFGILCIAIFLSARNGNSQTLSSIVTPLLVSPPAGFDVDSIATGHPRFIDVDAFRTKIDDPAYATFGSGSDNARQFIAASSDFVANGLLWQLDGDTTARDQAKADLLSNSFVKNSIYWSGATSAYPSAAMFWAYDFLADELTLAEKTTVYNHLCSNMGINPATLEYDSNFSVGIDYWTNGAHEAQQYPHVGCAWNWWLLLAFAHDGVADTLISNKIDAVVNDTDTFIYNPWRVVNASIVSNLGLGGSDQGRDEGFGGSYYGHFMLQFPPMLSAHKQATGNDIFESHAYMKDTGRDWFYNAFKHNQPGNNGVAAVAYADALQDSTRAGLAKHVQEKLLVAFGKMPVLLVGDQRTASITPEAAGLPLRPGIQAVGDLWCSLTGYDIGPTGAATRVRVNTRRMDVERIEADAGSLAIDIADVPITVTGDRKFVHRDSGHWSNQWIEGDTRTFAYEAHQRRPFFDAGAGAYVEAQTPEEALSEGLLRFRSSDRLNEQTGTNWTAVWMNTTDLWIAQDYGLTRSNRVVYHDHVKDIVIVWDRIDAPSTVKQGLTFRHIDVPVIDDANDSWTIAGARFQSMNHPIDASSWIGGLNKESVNIFVPDDPDPIPNENWHQDTRGGAPGYSIFPLQKEAQGLGCVAIIPAAHAAMQIYVTVIDVRSQYVPATIAGTTVTMDGVAVDIDNDGIITVDGVTTNTPPVASSVVVSGVTREDETLSVVYAYNDADGDLEGATQIAWLRDGIVISGATSSAYTLVTADVGTRIKARITPRDDRGAIGLPVDSTESALIDALMIASESPALPLNRILNRAKPRRMWIPVR